MDDEAFQEQAENDEENLPGFSRAFRHADQPELRETSSSRLA